MTLMFYDDDLSDPFCIGEHPDMEAARKAAREMLEREGLTLLDATITEGPSYEAWTLEHFDLLLLDEQVEGGPQ